MRHQFINIIFISILTLLFTGCVSSPQKTAGSDILSAQHWTGTAGVDINSKDPQGLRAIDWAVYNGNVDVVKFFLDKGIDGSNLEMANAAMSGNVAMIQLLLDHGVKADGSCAKARSSAPCKITPLHWAAWSCSIEAVELLVEHGASVNAVSTAYAGTMGWTPTDWALDGAVLGAVWKRSKFEAIATYLISKGGVFRTRHENEMANFGAAFVPFMGKIAALNGATNAAKILNNVPTSMLKSSKGSSEEITDRGPSSNPACGCPGGFSQYRDGHCYKTAAEACKGLGKDCKAETCN